MLHVAVDEKTGIIKNVPKDFRKMLNLLNDYSMKDILK